MGFNVGVSANMDDISSELECDKFIERSFYNWVVEFDVLGDQSCIIRTGNYFGMNLEPLTKLIYTNDELPIEYIESGLQKIDFLLELLNELISKINSDRLFIDQLDTGAKDEDEVKKSIGSQRINPQLEESRWRKYIVDGDFMEHLNILKNSIECFKSKGQTQVFLTAG